MAVTYEPIASTTLGSAATSVTFSSIPGTYTDLVLVAFMKESSGTTYTSLRLNGDTGTNFSTTDLYGSGGSAISTRQSNQSVIANGQSSTGGSYTATIINLMSYANTNVFKTTLAATVNPAVLVLRSVGLWRSTSAITSVTLLTSTADTWVAGSTFSLYGIKAA